MAPRETRVSAHQKKTKNAVDKLESATLTLGSSPSVQFMIAEILRNCRTPSELFELCYWSQEPGLFDLYRSVARLPEPARKPLESFLSHVKEKSDVSIVLEQDGDRICINLRLTDCIEPVLDADSDRFANNTDSGG